MRSLFELLHLPNAGYTVYVRDYLYKTKEKIPMKKFHVGILAALAITMGSVLYSAPGVQVEHARQQTVEVSKYDYHLISVAHAEQPAADIVIQLATHWNDLGPYGIASAILMLIIFFFSSSYCKNWFGVKSPWIRRLIVVVCGQAIGLLSLLKAGMPFPGAVVNGLIVSGGAMVIWQCIKPLIEKPAQPTQPAQQ